jgi:hypothetical protein
MRLATARKPLIMPVNRSSESLEKRLSNGNQRTLGSGFHANRTATEENGSGCSASYCNFEYSAFASRKIGVSGSASFQIVRKS